MTKVDAAYGRSPASGIAQRIKGLFSRSGRMTVQPSRVASVDHISPDFTLIRLEGELFRAGQWTAGDKIQLAVAPGPIGRTYTPLSWNRQRGVAEVLVYLHGDAPGCDWARRLTAGQDLQVVGPRPSIALNALEQPTILFGDETCFGLALALHNLPGAANIRYIFEVGDAAQTESVLTSLGLHNALLYERRPDDSHLEAIGNEWDRLASGAGSLVLAGKASSIQFVQRANRASSARIHQVKTKAYWAPGKRGLG
ncbi:NADPH-dependent ferric siderophore reductase [Sphingopyxis panaciterrae]|uniref:siderophore-interacting protein n=1 Tax=Sphingopyxis panaciterrae TaxID=363841 RepID=UPI0014220249|nr:siderophore-interacting protein [Sphingopyxis panaciterrae]NIJ37428.1 NADPH-dependent ferric siderophore reductase [Sphingopyxis panaciterrae]